VGDVLSSTNPTGGVSAWHIARVDSEVLWSISCPSASLCVGADQAGNVLSSTNPTGGASAWRRTHVVPGGPLPSVSCPSVSLCVVSEADRGILSSTDPAGGRSAWHVARVKELGSLAPIACPSVSLCVVGDGVRGIATSTNPTGGAGAWSLAHVDGNNFLNSVSCPSVTLCIAVDNSGNILTGSPVAPSFLVPRVIVGPLAHAVTLTAIRRGRVFRVDSGLAIACPSLGPTCTVNGYADSADPILRSIGHVQLTIPAGRRREVMLTLNSRAARALQKNQIVVGALKITARAGRGAAVADGLRAVGLRLGRA
jgi:hypothetical protein